MDICYFHRLLEFVVIIGGVKINQVTSVKEANKFIPFIWSCTSVLAPKIKG